MSGNERSLTGFVRDQCLNILRGFNADTDWVEGANFWSLSDILPLRVAASTFSGHLPIATFRRSFRAESLVHSSFLVSKLEQHGSVCSTPILMSQQLLRHLNHTKPSPWSHIEVHLKRGHNSFLRFCSGSISLDSSSGTVPSVACHR